jgi:hypothetical protein
MQEFPWLTEEDLSRACGFHPAVSGKKRKRKKVVFEDDSSSDSSVAGPEEALFEPPFDEEEGELILERLAQVRAEHEEDAGEDDGFQLKILGGKWTAQHVGTVADRVAANASGQVAKDWCTIFGWPKSTSFSFNRYSEAGAVQLAREVVRRGNYFYKLWLHSEEEDPQYTVAQHAGYVEDLEWLDWICAEDNASLGFARGQAVRSMVPENPLV